MESFCFLFLLNQFKNKEFNSFKYDKKNNFINVRAKGIGPMLLAVHNYHPNTFPENCANIFCYFQQVQPSPSQHSTAEAIFQFKLVDELPPAVSISFLFLLLELLANGSLIVVAGIRSRTLIRDFTGTSSASSSSRDTRTAVR